MTRQGLLLGFFVLSLLALAQGAAVRWMPLGDSITDYGCWRAWIWQRFQQDGHEVDLVGSQRAGEDCSGLPFDRDHEGHPGYRATDIAARNDLVGWLRQSPADVVTMHLGTVDLLRGMLSPPQVLAALDTLVDQMRDSNPAMRIIVSVQHAGMLRYHLMLTDSRLPSSSLSPLRTSKSGTSTRRSRRGRRARTRRRPRSGWWTSGPTSPAPTCTTASTRPRRATS